MKATHWILALCLLALGGSPVMAERPNVLFIAIDDLNDWVGCFGGNPQVKTPNFDRFHAEGGMVMFNAHAPSTVCCPSRSALLTGVHCHKTGVYGNSNNLRNAPKAKDLVLNHIALGRFDKADYFHMATALRTSQWVHFVDPFDQHGPGLATASTARG